MPDWDQDSPKLQSNLLQVLNEIALSAELREEPTVEWAREWQRTIMSGLTLPDSRYAGSFRGEPGLEHTQVRVFNSFGTAAPEVAKELKAFELKLQRLIVAMDSLIPASRKLSADDVAAVLDLCAWCHAEWIRIHPFANGNGRTARLWANSFAMRYGLPPFVRLRPRPGAGYEGAGARAMSGDWKSTVVVFQQMLNILLDEAELDAS